MSGLVTIEDVLEQIVGDIEDEYDFDEAEDNIRLDQAGRYRVKATTEIEDFKRGLRLRFSDEEVDTVGGLVIRQLGRLPSAERSFRSRASGSRCFAPTVARCIRCLSRRSPQRRRFRRSDALRRNFAALAGFVAVGAFAPFGLFPLAPLSLALLFSLLLRAQGGAGLRAGLRLGLGFFLGGVSWLYVALNRYGGMPPALAGFAIFLFCAYLALFPATVGALYARLRRGGLWCDGLLVAGLWTIAEWLRGTLLTGFPWLAVGYSQTPPSPLAGLRR